MTVKTEQWQLNGTSHNKECKRGIKIKLKDACPHAEHTQRKIKQHKKAMWLFTFGK